MAHHGRAPGQTGGSGHQPVAGSRSELGADVHRRREGVEDQARGHEDQTGEQPGRLGQPGQHRVDDETDDDGVEDGPQTGRLPQWDPEQQHRERGDDDDLAEAERDVEGEALVEDVPRHDTEGAPDEERHGDAVENEAEEQLRDASAEPPCPELGEGSERDELATWVGAHGSTADDQR
ncbi:MAG: hypothetical protein LC679_05380 [Intrasporangiaceae bacterium]|nr:hypothetical protein [Intrasporangiaceae bacterium]